MANKCQRGQVYDIKIGKCRPVTEQDKKKNLAEGEKIVADQKARLQTRAQAIIDKRKMGTMGKIKEKIGNLKRKF